MSTLANQLVRAGVTSEPVAVAGLAIGLKTAMAPKRLLSRFNDDQNGSVALIFGLTLFPVVFFVGMAVDFSKALTIRAQTQVALDAASIAAGRAYMTAPAGTTTAGKYALAKAAAENYYSAARPKSVMQAYKTDGTADNGLTFIEPTGAQTEFTVRATNWIKTPFLSAAEALKRKSSPGTDASIPVGCRDSGWRCMKIASTAGAMVAAGGSNTGVSIETSLMLDVSGSMGPGYGDGNKMEDMKTAAKDFIDILVWDGQATSATKSRVALAPFSQSVNAGEYAAAATGSAATSTSTRQVSNGVCIEWRSNGSCRRYGTTTETYATYIRPCVVERLGSNAATDEVPSATNGWIGNYTSSNAPSGYEYDDALSSSNTLYNSAGSCSSGNPGNDAAFMPMTYDKDALKGRIGTLQPEAGTAGHLGTAWAWYALSPKWNSIWPTDSQASAYNNATVKKIAVLMTDGDYNQDYSTGSSNSKASALCTAMKSTDVGITVYTVGFQVSETAKTFLKACATSVAHYYDATTGDALKQAFRDIALKVSSLRISK